MDLLALIPHPPPGFAGTMRYRISPRAKRSFNTVLDAAHLLGGGPVRESVVTADTTDDGLVLHIDHPALGGSIRDELRLARTPAGLTAKSLVREVVDARGVCLRREDVGDFAHARFGLPGATYPEVALPFMLGWMPLDGQRRSLYAWINDRFVAKVYVEVEGRTTVKLPGGAVPAIAVVMYPDLNDWVSMGSLLTRLAKPFLPMYRMWFDPETPHRLLRFEGPQGPPGAPEFVLERAS